MNDIEKEQIKIFVSIFERQANRKAEENYDGMTNIMSMDKALRLSIEELGEVSTAITRERYISAMYECLDVAHCAFLMWLSIKRQINKDFPEWTIK